MNFTPTEEQGKILNCSLSGNKTIKIVAFAGTGKTTVLKEYSKKYPNKKILYLAFNKSVKEEAKKDFPKNVTCHTAHSLAYGEIGHYYRHKLCKTSLRLNTLVEQLNLNDYVENYKDLNAFSLSKLVSDTLHKYLISSNDHIDKRHLSSLCLNIECTENGLGLFDDICTDNRNQKLLRDIIDLVEKLWELMKDNSFEPIEMTHDGYLKLYQLSKPDLSHYDVILLDEAQDTNPVVLDIFSRQDCLKILVGDPYQQIYTFRGAIDAMDRVSPDETFYLTNSYRFGSCIGWLATKILSTFKQEKKKLIGKKEDVFRDFPITYAIIARTNSGLFRKACDLLYSDKKFYFLGGVDGYKFDEILATYYLYSNQLNHVKDPFLRKIGSFRELKAFADKTNDWDILTKCLLVEQYEDEIPKLIEEIIKSSHENRKQADIILTTAHKAKGAQFDSVMILDDFPKLMTTAGEGNTVKPNTGLIPDEHNLMYVSITRAQKDLRVPESWVDFFCYNEKNDDQVWGKISTFLDIGDNKQKNVSVENLMTSLPNNNLIKSNPSAQLHTFETSDVGNKINTSISINCKYLVSKDNGTSSPELVDLSSAIEIAISDPSSLFMSMDQSTGWISAKEIGIIPSAPNAFADQEAKNIKHEYEKDIEYTEVVEKESDEEKEENFKRYWDTVPDRWKSFFKHIFTCDVLGYPEEFYPIEHAEYIESFFKKTDLDLGYSGLSDISLLAELSHLTKLDLMFDSLADLSPLSGLTNLKSLDLTDNQVTDLSPLSGLTNLKSLRLMNNQVTDLSPLSGLTNLKSLYLTDNQVTDLSPLSGLTNLKSLDLSNNQVTDLSPLSGLTNLNYLDLNDNNQVTDLSSLAELTNLVLLDIYCTKVSDLSSLHRLVNLEQLNLAGTKIIELAPLTELNNLAALNLSGTQVTDLTPLAALTNLKWLDLFCTQVTDISPLAELSNLTYLNLSGTQVQNISSLDALSNLSELLPPSSDGNSFGHDGSSSFDRVSILGRILHVYSNRTRPEISNVLLVCAGEVVIHGVQLMPPKIIGIIQEIWKAMGKPFISSITVTRDELIDETRGSKLTGVFDTITKSVVVSLQQLWEDCTQPECLQRMGMAEQVWVTLIQVIAIEIVHSEESDAGKCEQRAKDIVTTIAQKFDLECPAILDMGWLGHKLDEWYASIEGSDEKLHKLQRQMRVEGVPYIFESGKRLSCLRQWFRLYHIERREEEAWDEAVGSLILQGAVANR